MILRPVIFTSGIANNTKARFTLQKISGTAGGKMARVPKRGFGSDKICRVNNLSVPNFNHAEPKICTRAGTFGEVVRARVKMVRVLKKKKQHGSDRPCSVNTLAGQI